MKLLVISLIFSPLFAHPRGQSTGGPSSSFQKGDMFLFVPGHEKCTLNYNEENEIKSCLLFDPPKDCDTEVYKKLKQIVRDNNAPYCGKTDDGRMMFLYM